MKPGLAVRITPSTVIKAETGSLVGRVTEVSAVPVSPAAMLPVIGNESLVARFGARGAPFAVRMELDRSADGGYQWATGDGPRLTLSSGTLAQAEIVVKSDPPLIVLLPYLRRLFAQAPQ